MTEYFLNNRTDQKQTRKAAMYVRMSTDHQKYSTENQEQAILDYAVHHNIDIVKTYTDGGKSGLSFNGREGLKTLITDVETKTDEFSIILVLDVTRWGGSKMLMKVLITSLSVGALALMFITLLSNLTMMAHYNQTS